MGGKMVECNFSRSIIDEVANMTTELKLEVPISELPYSVRLANVFREMRIRTVGDLTRITRTQVRLHHGSGVVTWNEIDELMKSLGIKFKREEKDWRKDREILLSIEQMLKEILNVLR
jgi:DNA-directed RNA polymerase alpha subunit